MYIFLVAGGLLLKGRL